MNFVILYIVEKLVDSRIKDIIILPEEIRIV